MAISNSHSWTGKLSDPDRFPPGRKSRLNFGRFSIPIPASRPLRVILGSLLVLGGFLGFLPILGFWMIPLGLLVLSIDIPAVRRLRRRLEVWWGRRNQKKAAPE
jgi:hypothetical protein